MQSKLCGFGIEQTPTYILDILLHSFYLEVSIIKITEQRHELNLSDIYSMCVSIILICHFHIFLDVVDFGWQHVILREVRTALRTLDSVISTPRVLSHKQTANLLTQPLKADA